MNKLISIFSIQNPVCTLDEKDPCYKVIYTVAKVDIDNPLPPVCIDQAVSYKKYRGYQGITGHRDSTYDTGVERQ